MRISVNGKNGFSVVYHADTSELKSHEPFAVEVPSHHPFQRQSILREGLLLKPVTGEMKPHLSSHLFDGLWDDTLDHFSDATWARYDAETASEPDPEIYFGGHAEFTQDDPRLNPDFENLEICILQLSSDKIFMWGDMGMANFLMARDDLRHRRFEKAAFNWDSC
ncbi:hypothetical protein GCM10007148_24580 [Parvularcula lutaonensis]|nr:DUF1963 domain-containing protein [Parvularcula lutaonensis]GGY54136.1 hypothetical protein GCM10007148_24580 [Parvularcula lutaonensis]